MKVILALMGLATIALVLAPFILFGGWVVMLCLGALSHIFTAPVLAIGYWASCLVAIILSILFD